MSLTNSNQQENDTNQQDFWDMGFPSWMDHGMVFPRMHHMGFPTSSELANLQSQKLGLDLTEENDKWVVHADLPGFKEEDVELSMENGKLSVRATREKNFESDTGVSHRVERSFGEVRRVMRLPKGADQNNAQAHLENGVLTINFPKLTIEDGKGKKIPIMRRGGN